MDANTSVGPVRWEERTLGVVTLIVVTTALIFYLDLITPLGLTVWILYFIPLYLTFYLRWSPAPFAATAVFIALIAATSVLSYRDVSVLYALLNRLFFTGMLVVSAVFIWNARRGVDRLPGQRGAAPGPLRVVLGPHHRLCRQPGSLREPRRGAHVR